MNIVSKRIFWVLYDALNSVVIIAGAVYFTKWLIADAGISDTVVALTVSLASIVFIAIGPRFGAALRSEKIAWRALLFSTLLVGLLATSLSLPGITSSYSQSLIYGAIAAFFFLNVIYQLSLVAYNAYLPRLVSRDSLQRYSGLGESAGHFGSVLGVFFAIALLSIPWFEVASVRIFLVLGPIVFILSWVSVTLLRNRPSEDGQDAIVSDMDHERRPLRDLIRAKHFLSLIIVIFLYNNAFATLQVFSGSYLALAAGWDDRATGLGIISTLIGAALGGLTVGLLKSRVSIGNLLIIGLVVFAGSITGLALLGSKTQILLSLIGGGFGFGSLAASARTCVVILARDFGQGEKFGVYASVSRTSAVVGPLLWAGTLASAGGLGDVVSRQVGMGVLAAMIWLSLLVALSSGLRRLAV